MASTQFINRQTPITAEWLQDVNDVVYSAVIVDDLTDVRYRGADPTGVADSTTAIQNTIDYCISVGAEVSWGNGNYLTTASLTNLHTVRHKGTATITRGANVFYINPTTGQTNTLYCSAAAANDTADGLSAAFPIQQASTAVNYLANYGPALNGSWVIQLAAGTYKGGILFPRGLVSRDFIKIQGPTVTHPTVPTAIISKTADATKTYGIFASDGLLVWCENIKFTGAFAQAEQIVRNVYYQRRNVHVDGAVVGLQINIHCRYYVYGGIIENCTSVGVSELFHITRSYDTVASAAEQLIIRNCPIGLQAKENCVGHTDYINFEDCGTALELQLFSGTNPKGAVFKRNDIGIVLTNSELHNENAIVWGTGADINTRRLVSLGNSSEITSFGWDGLEPTLTRTGHRPLVLYAKDYTQFIQTGTLTETDVFNAAAILPADVYAVEGKKYRVLVNGRVPLGTTLLGAARILLRVGGTFMTDVTIPISTAGSKAFRAEFEVVCTADGNFQFVNSTLVLPGATDATSIARTVDMQSADRGVVVSVILGNIADIIHIDTVELYA